MRDFLSPPGDDIFLRGRNDNIELLKAWAGTSLAYAIAISAGRISTGFVLLLVIAAATCGLGILLHELAHRVVARRYGAEAHFVANNGWLLISVVLAFTGFFIAAPGAVWHRGYLSARQGGLIALAGPATNYVLALIFLVVGWAAPGGLIAAICSVGYNINAWLGLFNMIPAGPFDGAKVLNWDWKVFAVAAGIGVLLVFVLPRLGII